MFMHISGDREYPTRYVYTLIYYIYIIYILSEIEEIFTFCF